MSKATEDFDRTMASLTDLLDGVSEQHKTAMQEAGIRLAPLSREHEDAMARAKSELGRLAPLGNTVNTNTRKQQETGRLGRAEATAEANDDETDDSEQKRTTREAKGKAVARRKTEMSR
ncbi:hypothetical protein M426DRAFT_152554 [Hypoxylon sp. CI-4A]|nr:hypothetical protein M426DRAFT_152554 [Hypoxylon sp. CI-4A]